MAENAGAERARRLDAREDGAHLLVVERLAHAASLGGVVVGADDIEVVELGLDRSGPVHALQGGDDRSERRFRGELGHRDGAAVEETGHDAAGLLVDGHDLGRHPDGGRSPVRRHLARSVDAEKLGVVAGNTHDDLLVAQVHLEIGVRDAPRQRLDSGRLPGPHPFDDISDEVDHREKLPARRAPGREVLAPWC